MEVIYINRNNDSINVIGARERNLNNISLSIPKKQITVFTGVSGSGKSSLVFDTIAAESQRQLNDTYSSFVRNHMPKYGQPSVDRIENLPVSFVINQKRLGGNIRSTVGTITDIYSLLRLLYSRAGSPNIGYAEVFSFNNVQGMCEYCGGTGYIDEVIIDRLLDKEKSLNEGAITFPTFEPGGWRIKRYIHSGLFDNDKKLKDYTDNDMELLLYKDNYRLPNPDKEWPKTSLYEGLITRIRRSFLQGESEERNRHKARIDYIVQQKTCPECNGSRVNAVVRSCKINGNSIADCTEMQIDDLLPFIRSIVQENVQLVISSLTQQLEQMISIGLGYLNLSRGTSTLSGGESQRIKMVKQLGSSLCDVMYIFDEPSIGLHPYNVDSINKLFHLLRDKGNTVLIVEHDSDIVKVADYIIDIGPGAGKQGGKVVFNGSFEELKYADTLTAKYLYHKTSFKDVCRTPKGHYEIRNATLHNLKNVSVNIPKGVLTVITGVAGSGKSSLINGVFAKKYPDSIVIDQKSIQVSKRSNIATFTGIFNIIRKMFAKANHVEASLFSFNSKGACPICKGLGAIYTDLAFMDTVSTTCDACEGQRYKPEVLAYKLYDYSITEILNLTIDDAADVFVEKEVSSVLNHLHDVGIGYLALGQSLDTLSGGELQRVKLATALDYTGQLYIMDEPTTGLHSSDVEKLLKIFNGLVDNGNTLVVIEHNAEVITGADWLIDIGPEAGQNGGEILFSGHPKDAVRAEQSITGSYLKKYIKE